MFQKEGKNKFFVVVVLVFFFVVVFVTLFQSWGSPGPHARQASTLPLSYTPSSRTICF